MPETPAAPAAPSAPAADRDAELRARPFLARFSLYLAERFPFVAYTLLIASLVLAVQAAAQAATGGGLLLSARTAIAFGTVLLVFFHLRLMDESKDHAEDKIAHPDRVVSRGIVSLEELNRVAAGAILVEFALNAWLPKPVLAAYAACLLFTIGMRFEFGVGKVLRGNALLYAVTHHPIMQLLGVYVAFAVGAPFVWPLVPFLLGTGLGYEIARNTRSPEEDAANPHETTYSKQIGAGPAGLLVAALAALALAGAVLLVWRTGLPVWAHAAAAVAAAPALAGALAFRAAPTPKAAKKMETFFGLSTLLLYVVVAAAVAVARGVSIG